MRMQGLSSAQIIDQAVRLYAEGASRWPPSGSGSVWTLGRYTPGYGSVGYGCGIRRDGSGESYAARSFSRASRSSCFARPNSILATLAASVSGQTRLVTRTTCSASGHCDEVGYLMSTLPAGWSHSDARLGRRQTCS